MVPVAALQPALGLGRQSFGNTRTDKPWQGFQGPPPCLGQITPWLWSDENRFIIAGPCSAESEAQLYATAQELTRRGVSLIRAGVWKARTRYGCFEGVGAVGLGWLKNVAMATGLPVATEVGTPKQVEAALNWGMDCLWIGARTTSNPFSVRELAQALRGADIPLMVKNPIGADLGLWIGALERLYQAGAKRLAAIHRGFKQLDNHGYRNQPCWPIPLKLKDLIPGLPIFCDPSHICGCTNLIMEVSQKAISLGYNGLFIEAHCQPQKALTDAKQQLHPKELEHILNALDHRPPNGSLPNRHVFQETKL